MGSYLQTVKLRLTFSHTSHVLFFLNLDVDECMFRWSSADRLRNFTLVLELISHGENSAFAHTFAAAITNHYNLAFSFHWVPITVTWAEVARLAQHRSPVHVLTGLGVA